jgi:hypothetical protein
LIFKNTNLVGVWISVEVSAIFRRVQFLGLVGAICINWALEIVGFFRCYLQFKSKLFEHYI